MPVTYATITGEALANGGGAITAKVFARPLTNFGLVRYQDEAGTISVGRVEASVYPDGAIYGSVGDEDPTPGLKIPLNTDPVDPWWDFYMEVPDGRGGLRPIPLGRAVITGDATLDVLLDIELTAIDAGLISDVRAAAEAVASVTATNDGIMAAVAADETSLFHSAQQQTVAELVPAALALNDAPAQAAAIATTQALAASLVRPVLAYARPTTTTAATTQTGTPTFTGGALSGGVLKLADVKAAHAEVETNGGSVGTFCVEVRAMVTAIPTPDRVAFQRDGQWSIRCRNTGNLGVYIDLLGTNAQIAANTVFTLNQYNHIALQFNAGICSVFFNGVWRGDSAIAIPTTAETDLYINGWSGNVGNNWPGTVDAVRITKGVLYPAHVGFTPPTSLPRTSQTLLHSDLTDANVTLSTGPQAYPTRPTGGYVQYVGQADPSASMLVGDEWVQVTL